MTTPPHPGGWTVADAMRSKALVLAVCGVLAAGETASAQTVPYEAGQRARIGNGLGQTNLPPGGTFEPRVEVAAQYAANLNLAPDGEPQIDMAGIEIAPGFYSSLSSDTVQAVIDYSLVGRTWEDSDFNEVSHRLGANGQWMAVPEWFAIRGNASYTDGVIDPRVSANFGGLGAFGVANLQEVATASVNPLLQHRFNMAEVAAEYRYGRVWYLNQGKGQEPVNTTFSNDSIDQLARVSVGTTQDSERAFATAFYDWQKSEYETSLVPYEFARMGLNAGLQITRTLSIVGDVGRESDLSGRAVTGGLDSDFWSAGLRWTPSDRTSAEARYGDRSYGETYFFSATHRARLLEFSASYTEEPTVQTQRLSIGDIVPGELPPGMPDVDLGIFNNAPYISKDARASVVAQGSRTSLDLFGFWSERGYLAGEGSSETSYGVGCGATRQLASNLSADFNVLYRIYEPVSVNVQASDSSDYDTEATLRFNRTSSEKLTLSAEAGYIVRTGASDYDGWWVTLRARYTP